MTTIVNSPTPDSGGTGFFIGVVILVMFLGIVLYFGIPMLQNAQPIEVNIPTPEVQVVIPDNINVEATPAK